MPTYIKQVLKLLATLIDTRFLVLIIPAFAYLYTEPAIASTVIYMLSMLIVFSALTHILRKILFPYIDLRVYAEAALDGKNSAAAMVVMSVCIVMSALIFAGAVWMTK